MLLPTGTVTFLLTDIEGSVRLWEAYPDAMRFALNRHDILLREAVQANRGIVFKTMGDAFYCAFATAPEATMAALQAQLALHREKWTHPIQIRVRMAIHTGAPVLHDGDYFGLPVNRASRLLTAGHGGQTLLSDAAQELTRDALPPNTTLQSLGERRLRDLSRPEQIFQLVHPEFSTDFPGLRTLENPDFPNNLPQQSTSFIGREREMQGAMALLSRTRILTLAGSGGSGKTRLGLQIAADVLELFPDGVWLIELAGLRDAEMVTHAVAQALNVQEQGTEGILAQLTNSLRLKTMLIILDNCEHLLDASAGIAATLIRSCPEIKILATSREALGIAGEQLFRVPPLSLPDPKRLETPLSLNQYEAVQLFIERARLVKPDFAVHNENAPALAQLCHRLDGIPLAIELGAARIRSMTVEDINSRLNNRFRLLTGGDRFALPRQQTLRALIDWSYDLLNQQEKLLLMRLAVFSGGWTLDAAEQVCAGDGIETWETLDLITSLVDKSLVIAETQAETVRYRMLETVYEYSRERADECGVLDAVARKHSEYFLAMANEAKPQGFNTRYWLTTLEVERRNLFRAFDYAFANTTLMTNELVAGFKFAVFLILRCNCVQAMEFLPNILDAAQNFKDTGIYYELYIVRMLARVQLGDHNAIEEDGIALLKPLRALNFPSKLLHSLHNIGYCLNYIGNYQVARTYLEEGLELTQSHPDIGISFHGDLAFSLFYLGELDEAERLWNQELEQIKHKNLIEWEPEVHYCLGRTAQKKQDLVRAKSQYRLSLELAQNLGSTRSVPSGLLGFAELALLESDYLRATKLLAAHNTFLELHRVVLPPNRSQEICAYLSLVKTQVEASAFEAAWKEGRGMSLEQAVQYALQA